MLTNIEEGRSYPLKQEAQSIRGKRIVLVGDCEVSKAAATMLAGQGARVFFAAQTDEELGELMAAVARAKGEGEGMVTNRECPEEMRRFFTRAKRILGQVDVLVYQPAGDSVLTGGMNQLVQLTIQQMREQGSGHIISIDSAGGWAADLRRKARDYGIRVTRIEPASEAFFWAEDLPGSSLRSEIVNCVYESIAQPFMGDVIYLSEPSSGQML